MPKDAPSPSARRVRRAKSKNMPPFPGSALKSTGPTKANLDSAFAVFDMDGNGMVDPEELCAILTNPEGGEPLSLEQAKAYIARVDANHDGLLDKEEFVEACAVDGPLILSSARKAAEHAAKRAAAERAAYEAAVAEAKKVSLPLGSTWHENGGAELEPLLAFTVLVCVRWLLKFAKGEVMPERKGVVPACQELPTDAIVK
eukprot:4600116-Prymnesium_polylepis.1